MEVIITPCKFITSPKLGQLVQMQHSNSKDSHPAVLMKVSNKLKSSSSTGSYVFYFLVFSTIGSVRLEEIKASDLSNYIFKEFTGSITISN